MVGIKEIEVRVNRTQVDASLQAIDVKIQQQNQAAEVASLKTRALYNEVMHISRLILSQFKDNAMAQSLLAAEQVVTAGITIGRISIEATEAAMLGNWIQATTLGTLAASMAASQIQAQAARAQAEQNEARINAINFYIEAYQ